MAIEIRKNYWVYELFVGENELQELEYDVRNGKAEYVAGLLIGKLKSHGKLVISKDEKVSE